jgi:two-component system sensor histidine kinase KdpD
LIDYGDSLSRDTQLQLLGAIREQCDRLNRYTANLLNLSRLQSGIDVGRLPVIDLIDVIGGATNAIRPRLGTRTIHKALEINSLLVKADPILLEQVLLNILENAVAYSPDGSAIKIRLTREPGHARLEVVDQGIGIPPAELERVFERFHRVEQHRGQTAGSGLGLAIAKGFVEAIGGTIHAQSPSKDGAGTAIIIRLKLAETHP